MTESELQLQLELVKEQNKKLQLELELQKQKNAATKVPSKYDTELCRAWGGYRDEFVAKEGEYAGTKFVRYSFYGYLIQRRDFSKYAPYDTHDSNKKLRFCRFSKIVEVTPKTLEKVIPALDELVQNIKESETKGWMVSVKLDPHQDNDEYLKKVFSSKSEIEANPELAIPAKRGFNLYKLYNIKSQEKFNRGGNNNSTDDGSDIM
ncbi:hypothetical protein SY212_12560 [Ligilactobacillus agilis]|uniref:Uncharacterized protein n=1 Tax=Ligilactobacillus agilis TaxID=1601 RepID=A0A6F9XLV0_9LACO|nr:hypothetical protein [Ligilactobacillus agilis]GET06226.1 hypothetical protein SY212_12560 [Ligilactobacillus agilis]